MAVSAMNKILYDIILKLTLLICKILFRVRRIGMENVPREGGLLIISNHASFLDPPLVAVSMPRRIHFLAKEELFHVPILSWLITRLGTHPVRRGGADRKAIEDARRLLVSGETLLLFPEGTRTIDGNLQEIKHGAIMMATNIDNLSILPVYIDGSFHALPKGKKIPRPVKITVRIGEPFKISQKGVALPKKTYYKSTSVLFHEKIEQLKIISGK